MSVFLERNHLFLRNPGGHGVEEVAAMKQAGFGAIFCNVGDHDPSEWQLVRDRARQHGVVCGPWLHTRNAAGAFDYDRLDFLIQVADLWGAPLIVNSEAELQGSGDELTSYIDSELGDRDAAISVEAWPFDNVQWSPLADRPVLPQLFRSMVPAYDEAGLRDMWWAYGIRCVVLTYGSFGGSSPSDYQRLSPYGVYAADDCAGNYQPWASAGTVEPCVDPEPPEDPMTPIGKDHGVTAAMNRLRDLDPKGTLLVKAGGKWPSIDTLEQPVKDWKAYDKLERTLTILVTDHDEAAS